MFEVYGSTELSVNTILLPADQLRKPGRAAKELPKVEIRLYDDDGNIVTDVDRRPPGSCTCAAGRCSRTTTSSPTSTPRITATASRPSATSPIATRRGYLYICDRKRDMIISGGVNIYPAEIEAVLELHPDIYEAAVFGIPSDEWGEAVHAVVVARPGSPLDESRDAEVVAEHARQHLAGFKVPRSVSWMDELPKTGSGKILKRELRGGTGSTEQSTMA